MIPDTNRSGRFFRCRNRTHNQRGCSQPLTIAGREGEPAVEELFLGICSKLDVELPAEDDERAEGDAVCERSNRS